MWVKELHNLGMKNLIQMKAESVNNKGYNVAKFAPCFTSIIFASIR
jgi:hypothetical protein